MQYQTILADPPWRFRDRAIRGAVSYPTLSVSQLTAMGSQIQELAADNCHLYLWATHAHLPDALRVINAWGFRYILFVTWHKGRMGLGHYFRHQTEPLLFAVRGRLRLARHDLPSFIHEVRTNHSRKPLAAYRLIEAASPCPRLELFARGRRDGWHVWGNEVESNVRIEVPEAGPSSPLVTACQD